MTIMRTRRGFNVFSRLATHLLLCVALTLHVLAFSAWAASPIIPGEATKTASLSTLSSAQVLFAVYPAVGKPNQPRTVFLQAFVPGCVSYEFSFDTSSMETENLVVLRTKSTRGICGVPPPTSLGRFELEFTPTKSGSLTIRWDQSGPEVTIQTLSSGLASKFDTNGMWFDAATNGSGISLHHRRMTTDVVFGTWFLFDNAGTSRWYTLQSAGWQKDGSVLEGLLYRVEGYCTTDNVAACPAVGRIRSAPPQNRLIETPSLARITFLSATRARAEVLTLGGTVLFTSELSKLQF